MAKGIRAARGRAWLLVASGLVVAGTVIASLRAGAPGPEAPPPQPEARPESAPEPVKAAPVVVRAPAPEPTLPIENASAPDTVNPRHFQAMLAFGRARQDAVDDCRDRVKLPAVAKLLEWATVTGRPYDIPVEEISMQQNILFEVVTTPGAYRLVSATVTETWLDFPYPPQDPWTWRAPFSDPALERCVENALTGARFESPGVVAGERFRIQGRAGEAVYDLR
ncbi:MAG TPA: hypothetical protein VFA79_08035 [Myxococcales bacterium]|nr:hypothetical protein [Myxococcales bacterium]